MDPRLMKTSSFSKTRYYLPFSLILAGLAAAGTLVLADEKKEAGEKKPESSKKAEAEYVKKGPGPTPKKTATETPPVKKSAQEKPRPPQAGGPQARKPGPGPRPTTPAPRVRPAAGTRSEFLGTR